MAKGVEWAFEIPIRHGPFTRPRSRRPFDEAAKHGLSAFLDRVSAPYVRALRSMRECGFSLSLGAPLMQARLSLSVPFFSAPLLASPAFSAGDRGPSGEGVSRRCEAAIDKAG